MIRQLRLMLLGIRVLVYRAKAPVKIGGSLKVAKVAKG